MKCAVYTNGTFLDESDVSSVVDELRKSSKYKKASNEDVENAAREAIVNHNRAMHMENRLGGAITYQSNDGVVTQAIVDRVRIAPDGLITVQTVGKDTVDVRYKEDMYGKLVNAGLVSSEQMEGVIRATPRSEGYISSLYNVDMKNGEVDKLLDGVDLLENDPVIIQSKMAELDRESTNSKWDAEHSGYLQGLTKKMHTLVKELKAVKVKVSKDAIMGLVEPMGEYSSKEGIKVATADISEQARNRFIMGNEEAFAHETVHGYMGLIWSKDLNILAQETKDDIRRLYAAAKKQLTYKDLLPEEDGPYTEDEVNKAKEMYRYIFEGKYGNSTNADANRRLQEFMAYGLTNKYMKKALSKVSLKYVKKSAPDGATWLGKIFYSALDKLQSVLYSIKTKRGRGVNADEELTRLAMRLGEINYTYGNKVKQNIAFQVDEKVNKTLNGIYSGIDNQLQKATNVVLDKTGLSTKNKSDLEEKEYLVNELWPAIQKAMDRVKNGNPLSKMWNIAKLMPMITKWYTIVGNEKDADYLKYRIELDAGLRQAFGKGYQLIKDLIADFSAGRKTLIEITDMTMRLKSHLDRMRDMYIKGTLKDIAVGFTKIDIMSNRNGVYKQALNRVVMRTDFQAVSTDANELEKYLNDSKKLDSDIKQLEGQIEQLELYGNNVGKDMIKEAESLARYMKTKKGLRTNANNIARRFGSFLAIPKELVEVNKDYNVAEVEQKIDKLTSLYALRDSDYAEQVAMKDLLDKDKDGVSMFLLQAKGAQNAIKQDWLLNGMSQEMVKGQMREVTDANKDLVFAPGTAEVRAKMASLGYKIERRLEVDSGDDSANGFLLYSHTNTGMTKRVDGAIGLQRLQVKGLLLSDKVREENQHLNNEELNILVRKTIANAAKNSKNDKMYPVYNDMGMIMDFRYEPTLEEMETHLDLERRGTDLLAMTFGQKSTQEYTDQSNKELIDVVMKDTAATVAVLNKAKNGKNLFAKEFVHIHATKEMKTKAELKQAGLSEGDKFLARSEGEELWGLIPPATREYIIKLNREKDEASLAKSLGKEVKDLTDAEKEDIKDRKEIYIRKDLMKQLFGYNEFMISNSKFLKKLSPSTQRKLRLAENGIANIVQLAKNMVVIKLPKTISGNIISNAKFMWFSGMPIKKSVEYLLLSRRSLKKWKKDEKKRKDLERRLDIVEGKEKDKLKKELADLAVEMQDNPIMPLIKEGLYQTIAEDVNLEDDNNAIANWLEKKIDNSVIGKYKPLKEVVNTVFLTRRSAAGELMLKITQESDFHFRAAMYWYMMENGNTHKKAIREVTDNFINYNKIINSRFVQWLDRMGPEAFWKYFSNIQRRNLKLVKENTTRVALDIAGKHFLGLPADTLDSSTLYSWGKRLNPFNWINNFSDLLQGGMNIPIAQVAGY